MRSPIYILILCIGMFSTISYNMFAGLLRAAMQSMGYKIAPVLSSCVELIMKAYVAGILISAYGYLGICITDPLTWVLMTAFLVTVYLFQRKKIFD